MAAKVNSGDIASCKELEDEPAAARRRLDSSFISSNLSNRPRGPVTDPYYGLRSPSSGETLVEFLKYLELSIGRGEGHSKAAMTLAGEIPVESILKSQRMDWSEKAVPNSHVWTESDSSSDTCHLAETFQCQDQKVAHRKRPRVKCAACGIVTHPGCIPSLEKGHVLCKSTFRLAGKKVRDLRLQAHHWTKFRRHNSGTCKKCERGFGLMGFGNRDFVAQVCVWCMHAYHVACFDEEVRASHCTLGELQQSIVPPSWIVKLPPMVEATSEGGSIRRRRTTIRKGKKKVYDEKASLHFVIKANRQGVSPLLVFINPKSGGNQGVKLLSTFQQLLNPRQVFDLTQGGPEFGLRLYAHINKLRILVCGGDGTVGWVLSKLDDLKSELDIASPPIAVLPLGTGNDLARTLGWGGGYRDEPLVKIIHHVEEGPVVLMDRWALDIRRNDELPSFHYEDAPGTEDAPLHVVNNYFSIGADAAIALEFHESREANPGKFNSRMKNKLQYVNTSRKELLYRKYVDLCAYVKLFIDGMDFTDHVKSMRFEALLLQNILKYGAGSAPWGNPSGGGFQPQEIDDNLVEVMGMWSKTIATLHLGGHAERLAQGKEVKIVTSRSLPIQIDGEACMLKPSVICIQRKNQVPMVRKESRYSARAIGPNLHAPFCSFDEVVKLSIEKLTMEEYATYKNDLSRANKCAKHVCLINAQSSGTLKHLRQSLTAMFSNASEPVLPKTWCFVDVSYQGSSGMLYQIEQEQETSSLIADMSCDGILILELPEESSDSDDGTLPPQCSAAGADADAITVAMRRESASPEVLEGQLYQEHDRDRSLCNGQDQHPQMKSIIHPPVPATPFAEIHEPQYLKTVPTLPPTEEEPEDDDNDMGLTTVQNGVQEKNRSDTSDEILAVASDTSSGDWYFPSDEECPSPPTVQSTGHQLCDAAKRGCVEEVKRLIEVGANCTFTDIEGFTCLHHAARHGRKEVVRHLVQELPKDALDVQDSIRQQTALHKAAWYGYRTISVLLIEAGASLLIKDYHCYTPYQRSMQSGDEELMKYLQEKEKMERLRVESQNTDC